MNIMMLTLGFCVNIFVGSTNLKTIFQQCCDMYVLGILLILLSPLLRTLTVTISTDTIWALSILCTFCHLLTADYSQQMPMDNTLSLGASVFTSVLLASRLKSNITATAFLLFSFLLFGLLPYCLSQFLHKCKNMSQYHKWACELIISSSLSALSTLVIWQQKHTQDNRVISLFYVYLFSCFIVAILGPIGFWRIQHYKVTISGPWSYDTDGEAAQTAELFQRISKN
ncbi:hypothetical protein RFI_27837 [Reticulomyxa filosa]|uniref:Phosphatidylinositol N-acetylglucosaminyltransferase subunit C n=1 Tax=Reticulomyxa filosa TaxID=46433 RepID=X6M7V6_RETFI|nr:hypothetical protein RFI_27837 [Reticulomyxa filosa]|eukprot:ETO09537.1 hypothetical protein RFI_27837 [Reticulomyxa filosa]